MKTTLREINSKSPCYSGMTLLIDSLGYNKDSAHTCQDSYNTLTDDQKDKPIDFVFLLDVLELQDVLWCLIKIKTTDNILLLLKISQALLLASKFKPQTDLQLMFDAITGFLDDTYSKKYMIDRWQFFWEKWHKDDFGFWIYHNSSYLPLDDFGMIICNFFVLIKYNFLGSSPYNDVVLPILKKYIK